MNPNDGVSLYLSLLIKSKAFFFFFLVSGMQQLDMGSQFPDQELNQGCSGKSAKS